jgi:hypothetical protein
MNLPLVMKNSSIGEDPRLTPRLSYQSSEEIAKTESLRRKEEKLADLEEDS